MLLPSLSFRAWPQMVSLGLLGVCAAHFWITGERAALLSKVRWHPTACLVHRLRYWKFRQSSPFPCSFSAQTTFIAGESPLAVPACQYGVLISTKSPTVSV